MEPRLILVEGLPGAGKTAVAERMKQQLEQQGKNVVYYEPKCTHPADMAWQAYLTKDEYHQFVAECLNIWMKSKQIISDDELIRRIELQSQTENGHVTIAYHKINFPEKIYEKATRPLEEKEIYGGRVSFDTFRRIHLKRWNDFGQNMLISKDIVIFESSLLQNQLFEILHSYELCDEEILDYMMELIHTVMLLQPKIVYTMSPDIGALVDALTIDRANAKDHKKDWYTQMELWGRNTKYSRKYHLKGREGIIRILEERKRLDYLILHKVGIPVTWILPQD